MDSCTRTTRNCRSRRLASKPHNTPTTPCSFDECDRLAIAKTLCDTHYRQKRTGKYLQRIKSRGGRDWQPVEPRFFKKIKKTLKHPGFDECWLWTGAMQSNQKYGQFYMHGRVYQAHRAAWLYFVGPIPDGEHIHHKCGETRCVNPEHLQLSTQRENNAEMFARRAYEETIDASKRRITQLERRVSILRTTVERQRRQLKKLR